MSLFLFTIYLISDNNNSNNNMDLLWPNAAGIDERDTKHEAQVPLRACTGTDGSAAPTLHQC